MAAAHRLLVLCDLNDDWNEPTHTQTRQWDENERM